MPVVPSLCYFSKTLHRALIKQSYLESIILGWSLPRNMVVDLNLPFLRISMKSPRV